VRRNPDRPGTPPETLPESPMTDPLDDYPSLIDDEAIDEIELTSTLMIAASSSDRPLTETEVDALLGVVRAS